MSTTENAVNPAVETIATVSAVGPVGTVAQAAVAAGYSAEVAQGLQVDIERIIARYPAGKERSALIPMLHLIQSVDGYVSPAGIALCAARLGLERAEVSAVATFYSQFRRHPVGTYHVGVCTNALCAVMGGDEIWKAVTEHTGLGAEETSEDAPVVMVNWEFFDNQTPDSAVAMIKALERGEDVAPTRGPETVPTFRENERLLAGFEDGRTDEGRGPGEPTLRGLRIAREQGWTAPKEETK